jgi:hypothetical protein
MIKYAAATRSSESKRQRNPTNDTGYFSNILLEAHKLGLEPRAAGALKPAQLVLLKFIAETLRLTA